MNRVHVSIISAFIGVGFGVFIGSSLHDQQGRSARKTEKGVEVRQTMPVLRFGAAFPGSASDINRGFLDVTVRQVGEDLSIMCEDSVPEGTDKVVGTSRIPNDKAILPPEILVSERNGVAVVVARQSAIFASDVDELLHQDAGSRFFCPQSLTFRLSGIGDHPPKIVTSPAVDDLWRVMKFERFTVSGGPDIHPVK